MQINLIYDSSVNAAPAAFETAMTAAASFLDALIVNPITVNIQVGYGEDENEAIPSDALSLGGANYQSFVNYSTLKSDLLAHATTALDQAAVGSLPASDPTDGATFAVGDAEARALGLLPATSTVIDGGVGFGDTASWNYSTDGQTVPGEFDFVSDAELELIHALGMQIGTPSGGSTAFMLFRYSAPGVRELTVNSDGITTPSAYFSIDGGQTDLGNYPTSGDSSLFEAEVPLAANDTLGIPYFPGVEHTFSPTDALELNVLGFDVSTLAAPITPPVQPAPQVRRANTSPGTASDIVFQNTDGQIAIWEMSGTTVFNGGIVNLNPGSSWQVFGTGAFIAGAVTQLLLQNTSGQIAIWDMDRTTVTGAETLSANPGPGWRAIGNGNFYEVVRSLVGDTAEDPDLLFQNTSTGQVAIWEMNGASVIGGGTVDANPGPAWQAIGAGAFNGGVRSDILFQNSSTGQVAIWDMGDTHVTGGGTVSASPGPGWQAIGTGDFNGDGDSDILFQNASSGQLAIWEMNGTNIIGGGAVSLNPGPGWHAIGTNGGGADILFQSTSGQTAIWDMSGTNVTGGGAVNLNAGTSWSALGLT
jgi:hypothetical protein